MNLLPYNLIYIAWFVNFEARACLNLNLVPKYNYLENVAVIFMYNVLCLSEFVNISGLLDFFGLCPSSRELKNTHYLHLDLLPSQGGGDTPTLLVPLERANLSHWKTLSIGRLIKLLLALASTVITAFRTSRGPWPRFLFSSEHVRI
jgi:hypothetical protein